MLDAQEITSESLEILGKVVLSNIPVGGALITCVWDSIKAHAAQKRLDEWKQMVEARLSSVEKSLDEVGSNELFTSCIMKATDAAIKTAQTDKRKYLADAVLNSINISIDEDVAMMYLDMLDRFTVIHIKILHYFNNPMLFINPQNYHMGSPIHPLLDALPELRGKEDVVRKVVKDLYAEGLMEMDNISTMMTASGMVAQRTTVLGQEFVGFITQTNP